MKIKVLGFISLYLRNPSQRNPQKSKSEASLLQALGSPWHIRVGSWRLCCHSVHMGTESHGGDVALPAGPSKVPCPRF